MIEGQTGGARDIAPFDYAALREIFRTGSPDGAWMVNNGYDRAMAERVVASRRGRPGGLRSPLHRQPRPGGRLRSGAPLAALDQKTLYGGGAEGYTDYPTLDEVTA